MKAVPSIKTDIRRSNVLKTYPRMILSSPTCHTCSFDPINLRVHTLFWVELNKIDLTKIENTVWAKMSAGVVNDAHDTSKATGTLQPPVSWARLTSDLETMLPIKNDGDNEHEGDSGRAKWKKGVQKVREKKAENGTITRGSPRRELPGRTSGHDGKESVKRMHDEEGSQKKETSSSPATALAPVADRFVDDLAGYDTLGHVPSLEEFRSALSMSKQRAAGGKNRQREPRSQPYHGAMQHDDTGIVVDDLSQRDEVFRHFKRSYERVNRSRGGRASDPLLPTGLLQPDSNVLATIGRHTAKARRRRNGIGEGILSTQVARAGGLTLGRRIGQRCIVKNSDTSFPNGGYKVRAVQKRSGSNVDPLTNNFWAPAEENDDASSEVSQDSSKAVPIRTKSESELAMIGDIRKWNGDEKCLSGSVSSSGFQSAPRSVDDNIERKQTMKGSTMGSSMSTELQVTEKRRIQLVLYCLVVFQFFSFHCPSSEELVLIGDGFMLLVSVP